LLVMLIHHVRIRIVLGPMPVGLTGKGLILAEAWLRLRLRLRLRLLLLARLRLSLSLNLWHLLHWRLLRSRKPMGLAKLIVELLHRSVSLLARLLLLLLLLLLLHQLRLAMSVLRNRRRVILLALLRSKRKVVLLKGLGVSMGMVLNASKMLHALADV
jgi:hypothetical protein